MPKKASPMPSIESVRSQLTYDHEKGIFYWNINKKGPARAGAKAGAKHSAGYITIRINGQDFLAHRLAWFLFYKELKEEDQIDHINLIRDDNRIFNLRKATHEENCRNTKCRSHNKSKLKGAHLDKRNGKYRARICKDGKQVWLGYFDTAEKAHAAYCEVAQEVHGQFYRPD